VARLTEVARRKHRALATKRTYCAWLRRYCDFLKGLPLHLPSEHKLEQFLTVLTQKDVASSTQNQAFNAMSGRPDARQFTAPPSGFHFRMPQNANDPHSLSGKKNLSIRVSQLYASNHGPWQPQ
jgi:hypothetical protein